MSWSVRVIAQITLFNISKWEIRFFVNTRKDLNHVLIWIICWFRRERLVKPNRTRFKNNNKLCYGLLGSISLQYNFYQPEMRKKSFLASVTDIEGANLQGIHCESTLNRIRLIIRHRSWDPGKKSFNYSFKKCSQTPSVWLKLFLLLSSF